jgi:hypothetical protein
MLASARRYFLIITLLLVSAAVVWVQRWTSTPSLPQRPQAGSHQGDAEEAEQSDELLPPHVYFVDVEGWYRITPNEAVVQSHIDLSGDTSEAVAGAIPPTLGDWEQVGSDRYIADDPGVVYYLKHPTVAFERVFQDPEGQRLTLTIIGNKGEDSFLLFSHTPETCYPGRLWQVVESRLESALLGTQPMHAQYLLTQHAETGHRLMVLFWYLWDDPQRDSQDGVLSMRVSLVLPAGSTEERALKKAWGFVQEMFPSATPWDRF